MSRTSSRKRKTVDLFVPGLLTVKEQERSKKASHAMVMFYVKKRQLLQTQARPSPLLYSPLPHNPYGIHVPSIGTEEERMCAGIKAVMTQVVGNGQDQYKATLVATIVADMLKDDTLYNRTLTTRTSTSHVTTKREDDS
eukprot:scaffold641702_cov59-Attheya_sp.AAC.1